jgi:hypothetical protein
LCIASQNDGKLPEINSLAFRLRVSQKKASAIMADLTAAKLIDVDDEGGTSPHNWQIHQYVSDSSTERVINYRGKRRAKGLPNLSDYSKFRPSLIERDGECCVYCGATERLVVDHMIPINLDGTDDSTISLSLVGRAIRENRDGLQKWLA